MGALMDKLKGRIKSVGGKATGDRSLEAEGEFDTAKGNIKEGFEDLKHGVKRTLNDPDPNRL